MAEQGNALVVWGSTGRRLQFSLQDLAMPDSLRDHPHFHFYAKQWDAVASFWFNRVLKEASLQHLEVAQVVELIEKDIAKRWERRRQEQALHKKRKRLLQGSGPAGTPSNAVLVTNVVGLADYKGLAEAEAKALVQAVVERVEAVAKDKAASWQLLVDDAAPPPEPPAKKARHEEAEAADSTAPQDETETAGDSAVVFDDRVAVVCTLSSKEKAALAIAQLHGSRFDGRPVMCRFWA